MPKIPAQPMPTIGESLQNLSSNEEKEALLDSLFVAYKVSSKSKEYQNSIYYQLGHYYFMLGISDNPLES